MTIENIAQKHVRIFPRSIQCIDENGKTKGVVRGLQSLRGGGPSTFAFDFFGVFRKSGIWGYSNLQLVNQVYKCNGKFYYLNDLGPIEAYERYFQGEPGFESEERQYKKRLEIANKAAEYMTVIDCYIMNK